MRAMILAAGLGTRLRPLTDLRPKPALPVRGIPVIGHLLAWLAASDVSEVIVNLHHRADQLEDVLRRYRPADMEIRVLRELKPLGTGGGVRGAANFLREADAAVVLSGDMLLDLDLRGLLETHKSRRDLATLALRRDERADQFGSIGLGDGGVVRRIGDSFNRGGEALSGVFTGVRMFSPDAFDLLPDADVFEDLRDWLVPLLESGEERIRGEIHDADECVWEPVGTPAEYLRVNLDAPKLRFWDSDARARAEGTRFGDDWVVGAGATGVDVSRLERAIVWDGERVPPGLALRDAVYAGGHAHACAEPESCGEAERRGDPERRGDESENSS